MKEHFEAIINAVGEDLTRPGLVDTPKRAAKAMEYLTRGYEQDIDTVVNGAIFPTDNKSIVVVKDIELYSPVSYTHLTLPTKA